MLIEVREVKSKKDMKRFIRLPHKIYADDSVWIPPLNFERKEFFDRKKNPFFKFGKAAYFLALRDGEPVGRITAQVHRDHLKLYKDDCGFFGCFESVDDSNVAKSLIRSAENWLRQNGLKKIRGPYNFTINSDVGILVNGFETPPYVIMSHNPSYYSELLESADLEKVMDVYAWHFDVDKEIPEQAMQLADATREYPGLKIRSLNMKKYDEEVRLVMSMFNEVWSQNWGFIPFNKEEIGHLAKEMKSFLDPEMILFAHVNGDPAAFVLFIPNVNEAVRDLKGKLLPLGWLKLMLRMKRGLKSGRFWALGVRKPYRGSKLGALSVLMNVECHLRARKRGYKKAELGWTLETNEHINRGIEFMGGKRYKTYRIYEKEL